MRRLITILLLFCSITCFAQMGQLFDADGQLSSSFVTSLYQDHNGYIWIGTRNGLNRYDGYLFKTFKHEDPATGLTSNYINCITEDGHHTLYVGTNRTVQASDGNKFKVIPLKERGGDITTFVSDILIRRNGDVVISTSGHGLFKIDGSKAVPMDGQLKRFLYTRNVVEDNHGTLWILTDNDGLISYDGKHVKQYFGNDESRSLLRGLCCDDNGNVYVGMTSKGGVYVINSGQTRRINELGNIQVACLKMSKSGKLMIGCDGSGFYTYDPRTHVTEANPFFSYQTALDHAKVFSIVEDFCGNIWLGMLQKGVFMQPSSKMNFGYMGAKLGPQDVIGYNSVTSVLIDHERHLWVGTDKDGLYLIDKDMKLLRHYSDVPTTILNLQEDGNGRIWIGSYEDRTGWVTAGDATFHAVDIDNGKHTSVFGFAYDKSHNCMWMGTMGQGIYRMDLKTGVIKNYRVDARTEGNKHVNNIANDYVERISLSHDGQKLYVATSIGLCCLDIDRDSWTNRFGVNIVKANTFTRCVAESPDGKIFLGTNEGIYIFDGKGNIIKHLTTDSGLPNNGISFIEFDKNSDIWIGTDHGLALMNAQDKVKATFYAENGLQSNEFDGASSITPDGQYLAVGGTGGVNYFNVDDIKPTSWKARVFITGLTVGNKDMPIAENDSVFKLKYADNSFSLHFSTLTYDDPDNITYLYSINGEQWQALQAGNNIVSFEHLSPGKYKFRVKAMYNDMPSAIKEFTVHVAAPWYRSLWAYIVYIVIVFAGVYAYLHYRTRKERIERRMQEYIHADELNRMKIQQLKDINQNALEEKVDDVQVESPDAKLLKRIMNVINDNLSNSDLNVDMIAREVGISRVHLNRKMKELTDQTPHEFIRNIRLKKAANLLATPGQNVTEVMYACGFTNPASFSTMFKKFYGKSPRDYMRENEVR